VKLIIEPNDGPAAILSAIKSARKSVDIAIFRFDRRDIEVTLKAAADRGVKVTALIAYLNRGGEKNLRKLELRFLAAGITVSRSADDLVRYHDKYILIDRRVLCVLSFNFTHLDIDHSRGFGIITRNANWVREGLKLFRADCTRTPYIAGNETFVVSPVNSRKVLGTFLKRAKKQLLIYDPKISDREMLRILQDRAKAGVEIRVIGKVPGNSQFDCQKLAGQRLHTRTIIRDRSQAFIGSQSLRPAELDSRRELGLILHDAKVVKKLLESFESDWTLSARAKERAAPSEPAVRAETAAAIQKTDVDQKAEEKEQKESAKAAQVLVKQLDPLASSVKKAVRKAVANAGEAALKDKDVKNAMKKVVKKAVKQAVKEAVQESKKE
jgi:phosphatidylserine/phosphatidylglycerophosphate/cardiolipin synthase-like enzyme